MRTKSLRSLKHSRLISAEIKKWVFFSSMKKATLKRAAFLYMGCKTVQCLKERWPVNSIATWGAASLQAWIVW